VGTARADGPGSIAIAGNNYAPIRVQIFVGEWRRLEDAVQLARPPSGPVWGRDWLVAEIDDFVRDEDRGYFIIAANAGIGKTTFAEWLARSGGHAAHFTQYGGTASDTATAIQNLTAQLIAGYGLTELAPHGVLPTHAGTADWLLTVLGKAAEQRDLNHAGEPIVLVVDALDAAADQSREHLPLGLPDPDWLPPKVYIVATVRSGQLRHAPLSHTRWRELNAADERNIEDLRRHLTGIAQNDHAISSGIAESKITPDDFVETLVERSQGVWIYVRFVLDEFRVGSRSIDGLLRLPSGLDAYYHNTIGRLLDKADRAHKKAKKAKRPYRALLTTLAVLREAVDAETLARLAEADVEAVKTALNRELRPFCAITVADEAADLVAFQHASLREYVSEFPAPGTPAEVAAPRRRLAADCRSVHNRICDRYLSAWGGLGNGLPRLKADPALAGSEGGYALNWLTEHLVLAKRQDEVHRLLAVTAKDGKNLWYVAHLDESGELSGFLRDVERARHIARTLGMDLRYAAIEASVVSLSNLPGALVTELVTRRIWSPARAFSHVERMTDERQQLTAIAGIASLLPMRLLGKALSIVAATHSSYSMMDRRAALLALLPHLLPTHLERAIEAVFDTETPEPEDMAPLLFALGKRLGPSAGNALTDRHDLRRLLAAEQDFVAAAVALFGGEDVRVGARQALDIAAQISNDRWKYDGNWEYDRAALLAALAPYIPQDEVRRAIPLIAELGNDRPAIPALTAFASHVPPEYFEDLIDCARRFGESAVLDFLRAVAPRLPSDLVPVAVDVAFASDRHAIGMGLATALESIAGLLSPAQARDIWRRVRDRTRGIVDYEYDAERYDAISVVAGALADRLPRPEAEEVCRYVVRLAQSEDPVEHTRTLAGISRHLPSDAFMELLVRFCDMLNWDWNSGDWQHRILGRYLPHLSERDMAQVFRSTINDSRWEPDSRLALIETLAPHLPNGLLRELLRKTETQTEAECFAALTRLSASLPCPGDIAHRALAVATGIEHRKHRTTAIWALAPTMSPDTAAEQLEWVLSHPLYSYRTQYQLSHEAIDELIPHLPDTAIPRIIDGIADFGGPRFIEDCGGVDYLMKRIPRLFERVTAGPAMDDLITRLEDPDLSFDPLVGTARLAPHLTDAQVRRVWDSLATRKAEYALLPRSLLIGRLPADLRPVEVDRAAGVLLRSVADRHSTPQDDVQILTNLTKAAETDQLVHVYSKLFQAALRRDPLLTVIEKFSAAVPAALAGNILDLVLRESYDDFKADELAALAPHLTSDQARQAISHLDLSDSGRHPYHTARSLVALALRLPGDEQHPFLLRSLDIAPKRCVASWQIKMFLDLLTVPYEDIRREAAVTMTDHLAQPGSTMESATVSAALPWLNTAELETLHARVGKLKTFEVRGRMLAAINQYAGHAYPGFRTGTPPHQDWPTRLDRPTFMSLVATSAWWIHREGGPAATAEVAEAILDTMHWWP
jgi:hypothetical protein